MDITRGRITATPRKSRRSISALYEDDEIDAVYIVFNEFKSVLTQTLTLEKLLPIEPASSKAKPRAAAESRRRLSLRAASGATFRRLLPRYRGGADFPRAG